MRQVETKDAVIYCRVSSEEQANSGLGIEAQLARCREYCREKGYTVLEEFKDEGVSGMKDTDRRPGLQAMLKLQKQFPVRVIVHSVSRLTRKLSYMWFLIDQKGIHLESATEPFDMGSPVGAAMLGMLGVWAQLEAQLGGQRTKAALAARKARGQRVGAKPIVELAPRAAARIKELRAQGISCTKIAWLLNQEGVPTVRGGRKWYETTVRNVLAQLERQDSVGPSGHSVESAGAESSGEDASGADSGGAEEQGRPAEVSLSFAGGNAGEDSSGAVQ